MNCKPGDIAIVVGGNPYAGRLVEVLYAAPVGQEFQLPDGVTAAPTLPGRWVIKSLGSPFPAPMRSGCTRAARYGVGSDSFLRPLPGQGVTTDQRDEVTA